MDDDELRINTLHRFAKRSPTLILHEYSHCEVPAGCGGVVLRWLDPEDGRPAFVRNVLAGARATVWLDGALLASSLTTVRAGARLLAVHLTGSSPGVHPFVVSVEYDMSYAYDLISIGAPRWRSTTTEPPADWTGLGFDDAAWAAPTEAAGSVIRRQDDWVARSFTSARDRGQSVFQFEGALWLRVAFHAGEPRPRAAP